MANKNIFSTILSKIAPKKAASKVAVSPKLPKADAVNHAGAKAFSLGNKGSLAQLAATGCFNQTFYSTAESQLAEVLKLTHDLDASFIAKTAIFSRERALMKDMPALLCAVLSTKNPQLLEKIFDRVIDDPKMLRNFVQIMRSGITGRKSLGSLPKRLIQKWFEKRSDEAVFRGSVGQDPSMADVIRMVHPKPATPSREALYGYLIDREHNASLLPEVITRFEEFKKTPAISRGIVPDVPFLLLTSLGLTPMEWAQVALKASWQTIRMNLNTFARHKVFEQPGVIEILAKRLANENEIRRAKVFPYQLMMAYKAAGADIPKPLVAALEEAMEHAIRNVPSLAGKVYVCPDVSGSMQSPVTGYRKGATSSVRCIDVAGLVAASVLRNNPTAEVLPFEHRVVPLKIESTDRVMQNAQRLASIGGGGTNCSAPLEFLNKKNAKGDLVIYVSDNESWADQHRGASTGMMAQWKIFKERNPNAKLVCIDITPSTTSQAKSGSDVLNVGGFSDSVFDVIASFVESQSGDAHWVKVIEQLDM
jgi:60 kDa SS-A/Ro ribonucleoprotein